MAYSQRDLAWSGDMLGTSTYWTMGAAGCLVTSGADVLQAFGHDITPGDLNRLATSQGLIDSNGDVTRADWLQVLFPDTCRFIETAEWTTEKAPLAYFDIRNDLNTEIILMIDDSPSAGMQTHFMRVVGWDGGSDVLVDDSWDAIRKGVSAYGHRWFPPVSAASIIYRAYKYIRVMPAEVPAPAPVPVTPPAPAPEPVPVEPPAPVVEPAPAPEPEPSPVTPVPEPDTSPPTPPPSIPGEVSPPKLSRWARFLAWLFKVFIGEKK